MRSLCALVLAAGFGTRLRPITDDTPKCLVEVGGKPMLRHWFEKLQEVGCEKSYVNTHYLSDRVREEIARWDGDMEVEELYEKEILGTARTLIEAVEVFESRLVIMVHADNMLEGGIEGQIFDHQSRSANILLTMATFESDEPRECGVVEVDREGVIRGFHEKVIRPPTNEANAAIYVFDKRLKKFLLSECPEAQDFSREVLPLLVNRMQASRLSGRVIDIGTPERLAQANMQEWG